MTKIYFFSEFLDFSWIRPGIWINYKYEISLVSEVEKNRRIRTEMFILSQPQIINFARGGNGLVMIAIKITSPYFFTLFQYDTKCSCKTFIPIANVGIKY